MAVAERLPDALQDQYSGKTRINGVRVDVREDSSERPALFVVLVLSDPPADAETWPVDDLWGLRRIVRDTMTELEPDLPEMPWYVVFESRDHEVLDAGDTDELLDADG